MKNPLLLQYRIELTGRQRKNRFTTRETRFLVPLRRCFAKKTGFLKHTQLPRRGFATQQNERLRFLGLDTQLFNWLKLRSLFWRRAEGAFAHVF